MPTDLNETLAGMRATTDEADDFANETVGYAFAFDWDHDQTVPLVRKLAGNNHALLSAAQNVLALHQPYPIKHTTICEACAGSWPCPTVKALTDALEGGA